jgi:hypothetical protein
MSQFYIINESTEDTVASTDNLQNALHLAREVARKGEAGDPVSILESGGKAVRQFVLQPDGTVAEQAIARPVKVSSAEGELNRAEPGAGAVRPRE